MAWRFTGRARVNARNPEAFARCDRCGFWNNLVDLQFQYDWRGPRLANLRIRVCRRCYDKPFVFNKPIIFPPDPIPVNQPRPEQFAIIDAGTDPLPPLPWPQAPLGPVNPNAPAPPVYVTPPDPPLPSDIEWEPSPQPS